MVLPLRFEISLSSILSNTIRTIINITMMIIITIQFASVHTSIISLAINAPAKIARNASSVLI